MSKNMENVKPISLFASLVRFISFFPSRFLCYREVGGEEEKLWERGWGILSITRLTNISTIS